MKVSSLKLKEISPEIRRQNNIADGYIVLKKDNQVIIDQDVTGTTKAAVGNKLFPSVFTEGYTYITAQGKAAKESFAPAKAGWIF